MFKVFFFFSSRRRHTRFSRDWSSDVCSSDLLGARPGREGRRGRPRDRQPARPRRRGRRRRGRGGGVAPRRDRVASAATELTKEARVADQLTLGMLGGTGPQGKGLALRLATAGHQILLGSRNAERAASVAAELLDGRDLPIKGLANAEAAAGADVVFLVFPFEGQAAMLPDLADAIGDKLVVDVINPLGWDERGACVLDVPEGSAAEQAQALLPRARVVSAFHHAPPRLLADLDLFCDTDVLVVGDDPAARATVIGLADEIPG